MKQNYSNFVHLNSCLCMIVPKSFSNLGRFAQKLCSLSNMFQMTSSALETNCIRCAKLSITRVHSSLGISLIFAGGTAPPEEVLQRPFHSIKCMAWVAISKHGIIGPYWFEDENERAQTVNTERYVAVLRKFRTSLK